MKLRTKVLLVLSGVLALSIVLNYGVVRMIVFPRFAEIERTEAQKNLQRVQRAIQSELTHMDNTAQDWAHWTDTYQFIAGENPEFVENNLMYETFSGIGVTLMNFYDSEGTLVWGKAYDLESEQEIQLGEFSPESLTAAHPLIAHQTIDGQAHGVMMTERGPVLVVSRPILTNEKQGPIRGALVMARLLDEGLLDKLRQQVNADFRVWSVTENSVPDEHQGMLRRLTSGAQSFAIERGERSLWAYSVLSDVRGAPVLLMQVETPRDITAIGLRTINVALIGIVVAGIIVMLVMLVVFQRVVTDPLSRLTGHILSIGDTGDLSERLSLKRDDEIGIFAREFDTMLEKLSEARRQLQEQSYRFGMAEMAAGVLHNIRNIIAPTFLRIDRMIENLAECSDRDLDAVVEELSYNNISGERRAKLSRYVFLSHERWAQQHVTLGSDLNNITEQLRALERLLMAQDDFSGSGIAPQPVNIADALNTAVRCLPAKLQDVASIEIDSGVDRSKSAMGSLIAFVQVFVNLVTNAAESIERKGAGDGRIEIGLKPERVNGKDVLHMRVSDNGIGIDERSLDLIFQRDYSSKEDGKGGMGLHWCANAIRNMNGEIYAETGGPGQGAVIHLILPAVS
ncbi:MAG: HAMP domain-containing protein [Chloroflexi bacterium]|nr:MAG: HAMP domain-containing protein [Chloroflexota bacterium]